VAGRKRAFESVIAPEASVAGSLVRPFPAGEELQTRIDRQSVGESLGTQGTRFTRMFIMRCQPGKPESSRRRRSAIETRGGDVPAYVDMIPRQRSAGLPVGRDQNACTGKEKCIPFQVGTMKRSRIDLRLILSEPSDRLIKCAMGRAVLRALESARSLPGAQLGAWQKTQIPIEARAGSLGYPPDRKVSGVLATSRQATESGQQNGHSQPFVKMTEQADSGPSQDHARSRTGSRYGGSWVFHGLARTIRAAARFICPSRADLAMRGFAISFMTLASVASPSSFLIFFINNLAMEIPEGP
jgi:hypothetical protein